MVKTVGADRAATKYQARAQAAGGDYTKGVQSPKNPWAAAASAASGNYQQAVQAGDIGARFAAGINSAGDSKWSQMAIQKGAVRYPDGVTKGLPYYRQGIQDVISTIEGTSLPERAPAGSPQNNARTVAINTALHAAKVGRS